MKITLHGHLYGARSTHDGSMSYEFTGYDMRKWESYGKDGLMHICEQSIEVDIPSDFDPRPAQVAALHACKEAARAEFAAKIVEYDRKIAELLCIENGVVES